MASLDQHKIHLLRDLSGNWLEGIRAKLISKFFVQKEKVRAFLALLEAFVSAVWCICSIFCHTSTYLRNISGAFVDPVCHMLFYKAN